MVCVCENGVCVGGICVCDSCDDGVVFVWDDGVCSGWDDGVCGGGDRIGLSDPSSLLQPEQIHLHLF